MGGRLKVIRDLLAYLIPLFLFCGVVDYFAYFPMEGATKWATFFVICLFVSLAAMTFGNRRSFYDLEAKYRVDRRMTDTEQDSRR